MKINIAISNYDTKIESTAIAELKAIVIVNDTRFPVVFYNNYYSVVEPKSGMTLGRTHSRIGDAVEVGINHIEQNWKILIKRTSKIKNNINPEWK